LKVKRIAKMIAKMRDFSFTQLFIFFLGSLMCVSCVSGSNVCIDKISYGVDDFGKKYVNIVVNNYGDEGTEEKGFLHVFINSNSSGYNKNFTQNFSVNKTKSVIFYYDACECDIYATLDVENNTCPKKEETIKINTISVNFYEKSTSVKGTIYDGFDPVSTDFQIKNIKTGETYNGKTVDGNFSIHLKEIGTYEIFFEYCNTTKKFQTKHKIKISTTNATENEPMSIYISDENGNPVQWINIKCNGEPCASTDASGSARIYPEKDFNLSIDETELNWGASKFIKVRVKPMLTIETYPKENLSVGNIVLFVKSSGIPVNGSNISITKPDGTIENLTTGITGGVNFYANLTGDYTVRAFKDSYKDAYLVFTVRKNFIMKISPKEPEINEVVYVKILDGNAPVSNVLVTITGADGVNKTGKTDIDGEINFRLLNESYTVCASKKEYFSLCTEISTLKDLELNLSENFIFDKHYRVFSRVNITISNKEIPIIANIVVNTPKGRHESFFASFCSVYLNETGKYTVYVKRSGYKEISSEFYAEKIKTEIVGKGINNYQIFLNWSTPEVKKVFIEENNRIFEVDTINGTTKFPVNEGVYTIRLDERYDFKEETFKIKKIYDTSWLYMTLIMIVLIAVLMIMQEKYKKKKERKL